MSVVPSISLLNSKESHVVVSSVLVSAEIEPVSLQLRAIDTTYYTNKHFTKPNLKPASLVFWFKVQLELIAYSRK